MNELPIWDATALARMMGDNPVLQRSLHEKFISRAQEQVLIIVQAAENGDMVKVGSTAHALKSSSRTIGAIQLGELCMNIENAGKTGDRTVCNALIKHLNETFAKVANTIQMSLE